MSYYCIHDDIRTVTYTSIPKHKKSVHIIITEIISMDKTTKKPVFSPSRSRGTNCSTHLPKTQKQTTREVS